MTDGHNLASMNTLQITDDLDLLLSVLPERIAQALEESERKSNLLEIVMDLGRLPEARFSDGEMVLSKHEITLAENPRWSVPVLEFQGTPTGIDVTKVCRTGILPQINTGMAGAVAGVGQVGAGLVTPPAEIFPKALAALAAKVPTT